jgi:hypothetical protein
MAIKARDDMREEGRKSRERRKEREEEEGGRH